MYCLIQHICGAAARSMQRILLFPLESGEEEYGPSQAALLEFELRRTPRAQCASDCNVAGSRSRETKWLNAHFSVCNWQRKAPPNPPRHRVQRVFHNLCHTKENRLPSATLKGGLFYPLSLSINDSHWHALNPGCRWQVTGKKAFLAQFFNARQMLTKKACASGLPR